METVEINGKQVSLPCLLENLPIEYYHSSECIGVSRSDLDLISRSPLHYLHAATTKKDPTPAMEFGSLVHSIILEPNTFDSMYIVAPELDKRTKVGKEIMQDLLDSAGSRRIITSADFDTASRMRDAVMGSKVARSLIEGAVIESSAFAVDAETKIIKKCRPDAARLSDRILVDLKTTTDASFNEFRRSIVNFNYDKQSAYHLDTYSEATGVQFDSFIFICVEKVAPFGVAIYMINDACLEAGRALYRRDLQKYSDAFMNGARNMLNAGYPDMVQQIDMAAYGFDLQSR